MPRHGFCGRPSWRCTTPHQRQHVHFDVFGCSAGLSQRCSPTDRCSPLGSGSGSGAGAGFGSYQLHPQFHGQLLTIGGTAPAHGARTGRRRRDGGGVHRRDVRPACAGNGGTPAGPRSSPTPARDRGAPAAGHGPLSRPACRSRRAGACTAGRAGAGADARRRVRTGNRGGARCEGKPTRSPEARPDRRLTARSRRGGVESPPRPNQRRSQRSSGWFRDEPPPDPRK
jgi:hypothetical protein